MGHRPASASGLSSFLPALGPSCFYRCGNRGPEEFQSPPKPGWSWDLNPSSWGQSPVLSPRALPPPPPSQQPCLYPLVFLVKEAQAGQRTSLRELPAFCPVKKPPCVQMTQGLGRAGSHQNLGIGIITPTRRRNRPCSQPGTQLQAGPTQHQHAHPAGGDPQSSPGPPQPHSAPTPSQKTPEPLLQPGCAVPTWAPEGAADAADGLRRAPSGACHRAAGRLWHHLLLP